MSIFLGAVQYIPGDFRFNKFNGSYEQAIPHINNAFFKTIEEISEQIPEIIKDDLLNIISELSYPIPEERGNPRGLKNPHKRYSLERYISIIDRLSKKAQWLKYD